MPERTLNEEIAKLRGWKPPMSVTTYHADWLSPDGERHESPPLYTTDPVAMAELLKDDQSYWTIVHHEPDYLVLVLLHGHVSLEHRHEGRGNTLEAAVAAAWLASKEAEDE